MRALLISKGELVMKILDGMEKIYDDWKNDNQDAYGKECFKFAEDWAELMEKEIDKEIDKENDIKKVLKEKAFETGMQATKYRLCTEFMFAIASNILVKCWEYGKYLEGFNKTWLGFKE